MTVYQACWGCAICLRVIVNPHKPHRGGAQVQAQNRGLIANNCSHCTTVPGCKTNINSLSLLKIWYFVYHRFKKNYCIKIWVWCPFKLCTWGRCLTDVWSWLCGHACSYLVTEYLLANKLKSDVWAVLCPWWSSRPLSTRWKFSRGNFPRPQSQDSVTLSLHHTRRILQVHGCLHRTI